MQVTSSTSVGQPIPLISETGNHPPSHWAFATASLILDTREVSTERASAAADLQACVAALLARYYSDVILREELHLNTFSDHCDTQYDVRDAADQAILAIQYEIGNTPWDELIHNDEWRDSAHLTICNHLASAIHVERLLFAEKHPENQAAQHYKLRFIGQ